MAPVNRKPRGLLFPGGYKYLGPGNPVPNGKPINKADRAARLHDLAYGRYQKQGYNPYLKYNAADERFLEDLKDDSSLGGRVGKAIFNLKKHLAPRLKEPSLGKKGSKNPGFLPRKTDKATKRALFFARQQGGKKAKEDPGEGTSRMADAGVASEDPANEPAPLAAGGGGSGGGGGGGSGSVGISTGGWTGGTIFTDNMVITKNTRQFLTQIYNEHLYKKDDSENKPNSGWQGITTPWAYFNFNCYASHFSPQDWQRMTNEYKRWRPRKLAVQIYNLQIKQIVSTGGDTLYNNDLTAAVHIFVDGSHQFPYAQHPWDNDYLTELPYMIYKTPQYAYFQNLKDVNSSVGDRNNRRWCWGDSPLFILETASHEVLRTGEETSFDFTIDCGWVMNDRAYCPPQFNFNPLVESRRYYRKGNNNIKTYHRYDPYNKPSNWMPGPGTRRAGDCTDRYNKHGEFTVDYRIMNEPGADTQHAVSGMDKYNPTDDQYKKSAGQVQPANGACATSEEFSLLSNNTSTRFGQQDLLTKRDSDYDMTRWNNVYNMDTAANGDLQFSQLQDVWMYPMQAWNDAPIDRYTPIWDKVPRVDHHTILSTSDGTIPMTHPPGTIFIKCSKIPVPSANNADSYLNIYCTGQISYEIEWECERYQTKNWRPEIRNDIREWANPQAYNVDTQGGYVVHENFLELMPTRLGFNRVL